MFSKNPAYKQTFSSTKHAVFGRACEYLRGTMFSKNPAHKQTFSSTKHGVFGRACEYLHGTVFFSEEKNFSCQSIDELSVIT